MATGSVFGRWAQIVGADLAAHTVPDGLTDGELTVIADSTAWATQLRLLAAELVRKLNAELGDGAVRRVKVLGPGSADRARPGNGACAAAGTAGHLRVSAQRRSGPHCTAEAGGCQQVK